MTICNKPVSHVTDQGRKVCAEHASVIKADPADDAPLVHGLPAEAKNGERCNYMTPDVVVMEEPVLDAVSEAVALTETVTAGSPEPGPEGAPETEGVESATSEARAAQDVR